ncbi:MAG: DCL family protein [Acetobacteraceae bacterium]|nr:DCL family protein [Acetobacteraceae bacterium]
MARGNPVKLGTIDFATQSLASVFFKQMLARYRPGDRVSDEDALHLAALLQRYHEYEEKIGCGVDHFSVMMTEHGTPCFRINRTDGTGTDFSYD